MTQEKRIDFNKLSKPTNLQNSAVLRMLEEEEERKKLGKPDKSNLGIYEISSSEARNLIRPRRRLRNSWLPFDSNNERYCRTFFRPAAGLRRVEWPPTKEGSQDNVDFVEQSPVQSKTRGLGEYATYQNNTPIFKEEEKLRAPEASSVHQPAQLQAFEQSPSKSWSPVRPSSTEPKEYIIPVSSSWKSEPQTRTLPASKPRSWAPVTPLSSQPKSQQQEYIVPVSITPATAHRFIAPASKAPAKPQEYIVPVSTTPASPHRFIAPASKAPTTPQEYIVPVSLTPATPQEYIVPVSKPQATAHRFVAPVSKSPATPQEYIVPVSCPWKNEAPTSPSSWNKPQSNAKQSSALPTLSTWKPQAQAQIQIKQTPPTPPTANSANLQPQAFLDTWNTRPQQHTLTVSQEVESPQSYFKPQSTAAYFEPPATLITLRAEPPISQEPSPVYHGQPAATNAAYDCINMRGDEKWPPASVKEQTEAENRARIELAKGPVFRPRRVNKDYSGFFSQHAVTNNYPGYRAPPGTQYFTPAYQQ